MKEGPERRRDVPRGRGDPHSASRPAVVVTGTGLVSPLGFGVRESWARLLEGECALKTNLPSPRAIPVPPRAGLLKEIADRARALVGPRRLRRVSGLSLYAVAAAHLAIERARPRRDAAGSSEETTTPTDAESTAVILGTSFGSSDYHFEYYEKLYRGGLREASPLLFSESVMNAASGHVSLYFGLRGPSLALVGGEEVGLEALADSVDRLQLGEVSAALAGGAEESCDFVQAALLRRGFVSAERSVPYAPGARPAFFSEGAAFLLLEREDEASAREGRILARVLGYGIARGSERRGSAGSSDREESVTTAIQDALADSGLSPGEIRLVVASASGDRASDSAERSALEQVFGWGSEPVVAAPKALLGEGFAYTSAAQAVLAVEALRSDRIPCVSALRTIGGRTSVEAGTTGLSALEGGGGAAPAAPWEALRYALVVSLNRRGGAAAIVFGAGDT